jgi:hypothetical protein
MTEVLIAPAVFPDLLESAEWYELERQGLGVELLVEVDAVIDQIKDAPARFPRVEGELRRAQVHRFPFGIFFRVDGNRVVVFAILHLSRDTSEWKRRARRN